MIVNRQGAAIDVDLDDLEEVTMGVIKRMYAYRFDVQVLSEVAFVGDAKVKANVRFLFGQFSVGFLLQRLA